MTVVTYEKDQERKRERWVSESYKNEYKKMTKWVCLFGWFGCLFHMSDVWNGKEQSGSNLAACIEKCDWHVGVVAVGLNGFFYTFNNKMLICGSQWWKMKLNSFLRTP